jgi:hypothetical protein
VKGHRSRKLRQAVVAHFRDEPGSLDLAAGIVETKPVTASNCLWLKRFIQKAGFWR